MRGEEINGTGEERGISEHGGDVLELNARLGEVGHVADGGLKIGGGDGAHGLMMILEILDAIDHALEATEGNVLDLPHALAGDAEHVPHLFQRPTSAIF